MTEFQILKRLVSEGIELNYGKLTLCDLSLYQRFRGTRKWQIYCSDRRIKNPYDTINNKEGFYFVYHSLDEALVKFFELKQKISNRVR